MKSFFTRIQSLQKGLPQNAIYALLLPVFLFLFVSKSNAQGVPVQVYQDWYDMEEPEKLIDVSTRVVECGGGDYILVQIFNENSMTQTVNFTLTATNPANGDQAVFNFNQQVPGPEIREPDCSGQVHPGLMWPVPAGYDPTTVEISIVFN